MGRQSLYCSPPNCAMASNITVNLGNGKKQSIKTTPSMSLRQVVNTVCEKQGYLEPETYGLKNGKNFLDLSFSILHANIAAGAKLELAKIPKDKSAPTHVDLALRLEEGPGSVQSFAITSTLWDVLLGFERASNGTLNLTRRTGVPQSTPKKIFSLQTIKKAIKPPTEVYLLPVVYLLEREYVSIHTLKTTTLQRVGLVRGNSAFRVLMRYTDAGIEDFLEDIERDFSLSTTAAAQADATSTTSTPPPTDTIMDSVPVSHSRPVPERQSTLKPGTPLRQHTSDLERQTSFEPATPSRQFTSDKTAGEGSGFKTVNEAYQGGNTPVPGFTSRSGDVEASTRETSVHIEGNSGDINMQRQTPTQDMTISMVETQQGVRRRQEQETQAALTDRVKRLSKASDSSDRDRFVRSLPPGSAGSQEFTEEPEGMDVDPPQPRSESPNSSLPSHEQEVVRQIAHREIEKEQKAGVLPTTPTGSRQNSMNKASSESGGRPVSPQSRQATMTEEPIDRKVKVFRPPADDATPLSNQIELPDDFYDLTSQDMMKLLSSQKAKREEAENRGFKTAAARAEEEKAKERRYPKTIIRIRFPDRIQLQATFRSQETVGDLRDWVAKACVGQGEKFDLYTTPPKKVLADNKQTLYQAGLAPQSIVYFSWVDSKLNLTSPFLNGEHMMLLQDLPIPGQEPEQNNASQTESTPLDGGRTLSRTGTMPMLSKEDRRMTAAMSTDKPAAGGGGGLPKWMKLSKK
ncbi:Tether containing UBX domain for GLUT4 [Linnemannia exigua]|uniref:Tether containing UBX domain for GLUT4 n=1 Tax=Linnemannia exigua TaxID=604196 RepID=A0AAD4D8S4_9FUNG|nr:Tether containing UBX domain for GLUT4 [Linnemannia exigua]